MITFYLIGAAIVFLFILLVGSYALAKKEDYDILDLLFSLMVYPWFSWLLITIIVFIGIFMANQKEDDVQNS